MSSKTNLLYYSILFFLSLSCTQSKTITEVTTQEEKLDSYITHLQKRHEIPGVSLAVIKDGEVFYKKTFGKASIEHNSPIIEESIFRVYSLTKPIVAVAVFQLIESGQLSLEDPIGTYIKDLPTSWSAIRVKHLLTHSTGIPDMAPYNRLEKLTEEEAKALVFNKEKLFGLGEKYKYNQTNFWLLQLIIENVSGESLEDFILKNQFKEEKEQVFFSSDSEEIVVNRVTPYFPFETGTIRINHSKLPGRYMFAANGLNITMGAFIRWDQKLNTNKLLSKKSKEKMWTLFPYTGSNKRFVYGWDKHMVNEHEAYGFSGSLVTAYRVFPKDHLSVILLSNGLGNYYNIENIINHIASIVDPDIVDANNQYFESLLQPIVEKEMVDFERSFERLRNEENLEVQLLEGLVNAVGYQLINQKRMTKAIEVFEFNTQEFPESANAFDSLGEAYYKNAQHELAITNYEKAIALGGTNGNAKKMLARIKK